MSRGQKVPLSVRLPSNATRTMRSAPASRATPGCVLKTPTDGGAGGRMPPSRMRAYVLGGVSLATRPKCSLCSRLIEQGGVRERRRTRSLRCHCTAENSDSCDDGGMPTSDAQQSTKVTGENVSQVRRWNGGAYGPIVLLVVLPPRYEKGEGQVTCVAHVDVHRGCLDGGSAVFGTEAVQFCPLSPSRAQ